MKRYLWWNADGNYTDYGYFVLMNMLKTSKLTIKENLDLSYTDRQCVAEQLWAKKRGLT